MNKDEKREIIDQLASKFSEYEYFYVTDTSGLNAAGTTAFRRMCFEKGVEYKVYKNTLIAKALETVTAVNYDDFNKEVLKGSSGILFSKTGNLPAKLIKEFRGASKDNEKVVFKGASIDTAFFIGESNLDALTAIKSKQELIGDIIALLQSPAKNVVSALNSGGSKLAGIVKTLSEREQ